MRLFVAFAAALIAIVLMAVATIASLRSSKAANDWVAHSHQVREALDEALLMAVNAETGERGFLITGREEYLEPYRTGTATLGPALDRVQELTRDNPGQQRQLSEMRQVLDERLAILARAIEAHRRGDESEIRALLATGRGKQLMDRGRALLSEMNDEETRLLQVREQAWTAQQRRLMLIVLLGAAFLLALSIVAALIVRGDLHRREERARERARVYEFQDRLTGIVSHDLRNPLSAIQISIKSLLHRREQLTPEQAAILERAMHSTARIDALSELLIDYTRARLGRGLPTSKSSADASDAVGRAVDELRSSNPGSPIALEVRTENSRGVWDAERISQLASNLVSNALRYGRPGSVVTVTLADAPGDALEIRVHNHGAPISKAAVPTLFEPYRRGEGAEHSTRQGLGLGLYIVREIVRAHAGEIEVRSTEGDGTTFIARLPRAPPGAAQPLMKLERVAPPPEDGSGVIVRLVAARPA